MVDVYRGEALRMARLCFSAWNRDPASPSFGCFDRQFWGWKKKDFSDSALQAAITLCIRFAEEMGEVTSLPVWLDGYVAYLEKTQLRDGSFDQFYPNEHTPGVVHDMLSALLRVLQSPYLGSDVEMRLKHVIRRAVRYALGSDEKHGEIANHYAGYAWEFLQYGRMMKDAAATAAGQDLLARALALLNRSEGWFREYDGADPGYQTRLLSFLTQIAMLTGDETVWNACAKAARFVENMLMPDNSLHPMFGVRSTALVYPSGFERLAVHDLAFSALADRIYAVWESGGAPLPSMTDMENGIRLAEDSFEASCLRELRQRSAVAPPRPKSFNLPEAGLHAHALPSGQLYIASKLGGVMALYTCGDKSRLLAEDAGYLIRHENKRWLTRHPGNGRIVESGDNHVLIESVFSESLHEDMSPPQMLLLRFLNLTFLRSQWIGDVFRKLVVRRLIGNRKNLPLTLHRKIYWAGDVISVEDEFCGQLPSGARLFRCRRITGNHMASARYFTRSELSGSPWIEEVMFSAAGATIVRNLQVPPS